MEGKINEIALLCSSIDDSQQGLKEHEKSITYNGNQITELLNETIKNLSNKFDDLAENMCKKILDINIHRRKWSLIISGLPGEANEKEVDTRSKIRKFAVDKLKIIGTNNHQMAACHRLSNEADSPVLAKFVNLDDRNDWISNAKHLKNSNLNVSLSPYLPPALRPLKTDIMKQRKAV